MHAHLETLHQLYSSETQSFRKVHRMIDLFESIIKSHTVVVLGEYVKHNKLSDAAKGMLAQGLRTPSLGTWQLFSRVMFEELQADGYAWTFTDFAAEFAALDKALNADKTNVIAFRNGYAHGATPTDAQCEADIAKFDPFLKKLLDCRWLTTTQLETRDGKVWVVGDGAEVCVHPVLVHKADGGDAPFAFFNDLKNDKVGLLNYPLSKHYREKEFFKEFHEFLPLHEWKKTGNNEFYQRIEELTETFKGRTLERERLLQFVRENHKGYCSIQGNPGIGKSALIAQFFKDLRAQKELTDVQVVEYFIRRGTMQAQAEYVFNYLIRRTDELFAPGKEIRAEGKAVWDLQQQLFAKWRLWGEQRAGKKLLFLIDGLDEGTENNVVTYMPRENFEGVLIIYGSRPGGHKSIEDLWTQLPTEHHTKLELAGLGREDIRALIYEVANKYEVERESAWIDAVQQRSQGNPLYLKLLCDALEHGSIALNDIQALPDKIDEYYKAILDRYAADTVDGDPLLAGLFTFAAARDYLTMAHLGLINKLGDATVQRIGSTLKEVLYENPLTEEVLDYQLFHESFREYLIKEKTQRVSEATERIIDFCSTWRELEGTWEQRYALEHYAIHLTESKRQERAGDLIKLLYDKQYASAQKKVLKNFNATAALYQQSLLKASEQQLRDDQLEAALSLVDLHYEEANDTPQVVAMIANGEIDLALKRIESFGGGDEEGVNRKFTLYMLCLMQLALLDRNGKPFRKIAIERLLLHLDEHLPTDHSILNWKYKFPSYLIFRMACELAELNLDYQLLYKRSDDLDYDWLSEKAPYSLTQFQVLIECARGISGYNYRISALKDIAGQLAKQGQAQESASVLREALVCARGISKEWNRSSALKDISSELSKQGQHEASASVMKEALACAQSKIDNESYKSAALKDIAVELARQGKMEEAIYCSRGISIEYWKSGALEEIAIELAKRGRHEEALVCARGISDERPKCAALNEISSNLSKQSQQEACISVIEESLACARSIIDELYKSKALKDIAVEMAKQKLEAAVLVMQESFVCASGIKDKVYRSDALKDIAIELAKQGQLEEALACASEISDKKSRSKALTNIAVELAKKGLQEAYTSVMQKGLDCAHGISDEIDKSGSLEYIAVKLAKHGQIEEALACARGIRDEYYRRSALNDIALELAKQDQLQSYASVLHETLAFARGISNEWNRSTALNDIAIELAKRGQSAEALAFARGIRIDKERSMALTAIASEFAIQAQHEASASVMKEAIASARGISADYFKSRALKDIAIALAQHKNQEESALVLKEALTCALDISNDWNRIRPLTEIAIELAKRGQFEEALAWVRGITYEKQKSIALKDIAVELAAQGHKEASTSVLQEALACARGISTESKNSSALKEIIVELTKQGRQDEAIACALSISTDLWKSIALVAIAGELFKQGKQEASTSLLQDAQAYALTIGDANDKSIANKNIAIELAMQGSWALAEATGLAVQRTDERLEGWKEMAKAKITANGWHQALVLNVEFHAVEPRLFYMKGWVENVNLTDVIDDCILQALPLIASDKESIENLLQKYALHQVSLGNPSRELTDRLNRTLNIQWAMDIAAQFPKENSTARLSTNLDTWLHEIADEDDRDQITLWAKQVAKGKITEEEFGERVRGME